MARASVACDHFFFLDDGGSKTEATPNQKQQLGEISLLTRNSLRASNG